MSTRKTDEEIRERVAYFQASLAEEEDEGRSGGDDWCEASTALYWLRWVLGE